MFQRVYDKFLKTVNDYDLISKETGKIVIATSGGKDANIMTELLYRYQQNVRPDLELELVNAAIPKWKYMPETFVDQLEDEDKKQLLLKETEYIEKHKEFWEARGLKTVYIHHTNKDIDKEIYDSPMPCANCFVAQKQALCQYLIDHDQSKEVRLAVGLTKWDMVYLALTHILRCNGQSWQQLKKENPERYKADLMHFATFSPYPKTNIGLPNKKIYTIEPIIALSDMETREFAKQLNLPVIPDCCVELFGFKFNSDKRHFDNFLKVSATAEINLLKRSSNPSSVNELDPLYTDYEDILRLLESTNLLPPLEEFDGLLYETYASGIMKQAVAS